MEPCINKSSNKTRASHATAAMHQVKHESYTAQQITHTGSGQGQAELIMNLFYS